MFSRRSFAISAVLVGLAGSPTLAQTLSAGFVPDHPLYPTALDALKKKQWKELIASVAGLPPQSAYTLLRDIGDGGPMDGNLDALARTKGGAGIAGALKVGWAWRYRGSDVEIKDDKRFGDQLTAAAELLMRAIDADTDDGVSATFFLRVLKGAGEVQAARDLLPVYLSAKRKPVEGLTIYADAVSDKWGGSEAESLKFARQYAGSAPAASYGVIPDTHVTTAIARTMSDNPKVAASADTYFRQPEVVAEIAAADDKFRAAKASDDSFAMLLAHAQFSLAFMQTGDAQRLRYHLAAQGAFKGGPWRQMDGAMDTIARARSALGLPSL